MAVLFCLLGIAVIALVVQDACEAILLPRRVSRNFRFARVFFRSTWRPYSSLAARLRPAKRRDVFLSYFGPLSMLVLFGLWAFGLIAGFAIVQWSLGSPLNAPGGHPGWSEYLYLSGVTFFTLGFGDVTPLGTLGRALAVFETGLGFGFLAVVISYLPVLYQAFSQREHTISLLDARAGSPPSAGQMLVRLGSAHDLALLNRFLGEWEEWAANVLESHISFPVLAFYRSQHDNQSWLAGLTAMLDVSAIVISGLRESDHYQARLTFAMSRHAVVDLAQIFQTPPKPPEPDRLPLDELRRLREDLLSAGIALRDEPAMAQGLSDLRAMYEPFVNALAEFFLLTLPQFRARDGAVDNWQTSAWMRRTSGIEQLIAVESRDDHEY